MGIFDDDFEEKLDDVAWYDVDQPALEYFKQNVLLPRVCTLKDGQTLKRKFAVGVGVPTDFTFCIGQSLLSICDALKLKLLIIDCRNVWSTERAMDLLTNISRNHFVIILLENFDEIPDVPDKLYIQNILIRLWERDFIVPRRAFFVLFTTSHCTEEVPALLKKIKTLEWYPNIREIDPKK